MYEHLVGCVAHRFNASQVGKPTCRIEFVSDGFGGVSVRAMDASTFDLIPFNSLDLALRLRIEDEKQVALEVVRKSKEADVKDRGMQHKHRGRSLGLIR